MRGLYASATRVLAFLLWPAKGLVLHNSRRVRVAVLAEDKILLVRSSFGKQEWSLPGGGIEKNENPFSAAVRETLEETGVQIEKFKLTCIGEDRLPRGKKWPVVDMLFYAVKLDTAPRPQITQPYEILEVGWFSVAKLPEKHSKTVDVALEMLEESEI